MIVKIIILSLISILLLTMANPLGEMETGDNAEKNITSEVLCADYQIVINGKCKNSTERFFDFDIDVQNCSNENEIRNTHGDCIDKDSIIVFE